MLDLSRLKETVVSHSPYLKQMLNSWQLRIIPQNWKDLATTILEVGPHLS